VLTDILEIAPLTKTIEKFIIKKVVSSSKKQKGGQYVRIF